MGSNNISIPEMKLGSTEATIPLLGFGTAAYPLVTSETMKESIFQAIEVGYRHFDTASLYNSEKFLGEAIAEALSRGLIKSRDDLFITSKLWCTDAHPDCVLPALHNTLKKLGLAYLDLYLIHFPMSLKPGNIVMPFAKEDILPMDFKSVWEAMEECQNLGLSKNIGVSNFSCKKLHLILSSAKIPPAVNQVELSPVWRQRKLREFCKESSIHITAFSPLGAPGTWWENKLVLESEVLNEIAKARGKTVAQVCLRWVYQQGVSVIVKSFSKERMKENLGIFDWTLSIEECHKIEQISQHKGYSGLHFTSNEGPYKSIEDLWDEIIN